MILTDGVHLVSDKSVEELHLFAAEIGLRKAWFQAHRIPHYDLTTSRAFNRAFQAGAELVGRRELVRRAVHAV